MVRLLKLAYASLCLTIALYFVALYYIMYKATLQGSFTLVSDKLMPLEVYFSMPASLILWLALTVIIIYKIGR